MIELNSDGTEPMTECMECGNHDDLRVFRGRSITDCRCNECGSRDLLHYSFDGVRNLIHDNKGNLVPAFNDGRES